MIMVLPAVDAAEPRVQYVPVKQHTSFVQQRERKRPVFHIILANQRVSRLLDNVSATLLQTVEVTICIIPKGLLNRP